MSQDLSHLEIARLLMRMRALRWDYFRGDLFDEHAWTILLVLFVAEETAVERSETAVMREGGVPLVTGARWIAHLERSDLVRKDADDGTLTLTDQSRTEMVRYLDEIAKILRQPQPS